MNTNNLAQSYFESATPYVGHHGSGHLTTDVTTTLITYVDQRSDAESIQATDYVS